MKNVLAAVTLLVACTAVDLAILSPAAGAATGGLPAQLAKKKKKVKKFPATITLTVQATSPFTSDSPYVPDSPGSGRFFGSVSSQGPAPCRANRPVAILLNGSAFSLRTTADDGGYSLTVDSSPPPGQYAASTPKVVTKKKGKRNPDTGKRKTIKVICRGATTPPLSLF
jgi:hypothetical protein